MQANYDNNNSNDDDDDDDREDYHDDDEVGEHQKLSVMEPRSELSSMLQGSWHRDRLSLFHALK